MLKSRIPHIVIEIDILTQDGIDAGAELVEQEAKARVPVATGKLHDAIHTDDGKLKVYVVAGDDEAWYGHLVEHGTTRVPPRPFLVPSLEANRGNVEDEVRKRLGSL